MTKESTEDMASRFLKQRVDYALNMMSQRYKGATPFGQEPKSIEEQLNEYESIQGNPRALESMIEKFGENEVIKWADKMENIRTRRLYG